MSPTSQQIADAYVLLQDRKAALDAETVSVVAELLATNEQGRALRQMQRDDHAREVRQLRAGLCSACAGRAA